jgi:large subunit ribosomal protein L21
MYAVFQMSGFQFSGEEGKVVRVPRQDLEKGNTLDISEVLMVKNKDNVMVGTPFVEGATVKAEVMGSSKDDKVRVYKYKRRTKYRKTIGHRQDYTEIKINKIVLP